jgi:uncharacterized protein YacL (UPF0231 family)
MVRCFRDDRGFLRAEVEGHPALGSYLEQDIQASPECCQAVLHAIAEVESRTSNLWEGTGNAFSVTIRPDHVTVENVWDESMRPEELSLADFKKALQDWLKCISEAAQSG